MNSTRRRFTLAAVVLVVRTVFAGTARGEAKDHSFRVLGLFQKDREDDLQLLVDLIPDVKVVNVDYKTGTATFRFDAKKLFPGSRTTEQIARGLDQLLRRESRGTFEVTPLTGVDRTNLQRIEIDVVGLDCKGCSYAAYRAVYQIEGVENATASFRTGKVIAWVNAKKTNRKTLIEALEKKRVKIKPPAGKVGGK